VDEGFFQLILGDQAMIEKIFTDPGDQGFRGAGDRGGSRETI
jgi:hypothetical protein